MLKQIRGAIDWAIILATVTLWLPTIMHNEATRRDPWRL
jgi:hypothetical protein